jgi:hypothetical protein
MHIEIIGSPKGELSYCRLEKGARIADASGFLEALASCPTTTMLIDKESLAEEFFDLRSGLAGECLQKVSNYRRRLAILGDFAHVASRALRDFISESNRTGQVVFAKDIQGAIELLR